MKHIPNFITSLNLVCGFTAIIFASTGNLTLASWLILAAMIFDFLDGFSARMLKAYSAIGKELDSLADVVSFGVAPGIIIYHLLMAASAPISETGINPENFGSIALVLAAAIMPVCGAIRLAIFNLDSTQSTSFKGLPIPANALGVISIVFAVHYSQSPLIHLFAESLPLLVLYTIILSILMVTRLPLFSLKITNIKLKGNEGRYILLGLIIIAFLVFGTMAIPLIIPLYLISSMLSLLF
jgi:CDP-diacylglycerol---serine O-phosphatidyltransferase